MTKKLNCVLLIDDDEATNYFNSFILEQTGCAEHVEAIQSGQMALEYLTNSVTPPENDAAFPSPDLIFLDINMPGMNGWEFLEKYRSLSEEHKGKIVIVMLTTSLFTDDVLKAQQIPEVSGFESKPLTEKKIERLLEKYFAGQPVS